MINIYYTRLQSLPRQEEASARGLLLLQHILLSHFPEFHLSDICYTQNGKPYISPDFDFNISHSGNLVVCAFATGNKVGIDIEACKPLETAFFREYFSEEEWKKINGASDPLIAFYEFWTAKEAVLKAAGIGLMDNLAALEIKGEKVLFENEDWYIQEVFIGEGYKCHVCSVINIPVAVKEINV